MSEVGFYWEGSDIFMHMTDVRNGPSVVKLKEFKVGRVVRKYCKGNPYPYTNKV